MIFISYAWADESTAHQLHRRLELLGHETWIDFRMLDLGGNIETQLNRAIQSATLILLLDSPSARRSKWIRFELACAEEARTPVTLLSDRFGEALSPGASKSWFGVRNSRFQIGMRPEAVPIYLEQFPPRAVNVDPIR